MSRKTTSSRSTEFLNVDLDLYGRYDLEPLAAAFGRNVVVLFAGREGRAHSAHLELARAVGGVDARIRRFCKLVGLLGRADRKLWDSANRRDFNIGIQAGEQPFSSEFAIEAETVKAVAEIGARIVLTVYAPETVAAERRRR